MEKPVVFQCGGQQVVGMLHLPDRRSGRAPAVVFLHGFTGHKAEAHQLFVKCARGLPPQGMAGLRFDFRGSGDSGGDFSRMTIAGELRDAKAAVHFARQLRAVDPARIGVVGMSMGGLVASLLLGRDPRIRAAVLWCPVAHPDGLLKTRMTPESRRALARHGVVDYGGYAVGRAFIEDLPRQRPLEAIARTRAPVLLIQGDNDDTVPVGSSRDYEQALRKAGRFVRREIIAGADHTFSSLAWEQPVFQLTVDWLRQHLKCSR